MLGEFIFIMLITKNSEYEPRNSLLFIYFLKKKMKNESLIVAQKKPRNKIAMNIIICFSGGCLP